MKIKKTILGILSAIFVFSSTLHAEESVTKTAVKAPFKHGVNLTMWFESWSKSLPNLNLYTEEDFANMAELGIDIIRLPIHFDMFEDEATGNVREIIFDYLNLACDWAEKYNMHIVIDDHSYNSGKYPDAKTVREHSFKLWPQITERFKNRSDLILYEVLNEPQLAQTDWYNIQKDVLALIRQHDTKHTVVVTGADWGSLNAMVKMIPYDDKNLIYTFHYYDPFIFTHQGASWANKEVAALKDIPFPYDSNRIPKVTGAAKGSWVESSLRGDYRIQASEAGMKRQLMKAVDFSQKYQVPVWVGEMGVYNLYAPYQDRVEWYKLTGKLFEELNLPFSVWGYGTSFGIFKKDTPEIYPYNLDEQIVKGLGFNVPAHVGEPIPANVNHVKFPYRMYKDALDKNIGISAWGGDHMIFDLGANDNSPEGKYNIKWGNTDRYASMSFNVTKLNFSSLTDSINERILSFYIQFQNPDQQIQIRFLDSDSGDGVDKPWRLAYNLKAKETGTGKWVKVEIPLNKFSVTGAWSNPQQKWYSPTSSDFFDWTRIESLQFAAEDAEIHGLIQFDDIQIK